MKLFKRLLVAPAALGLLSPLSASASEVNFKDVSNYAREFEMNSNTFDNPSSTDNPSSNSTLLAGGEGMVDYHDGGFSETTTASFSADFAIGSEDGTNAGDSLQATYGFQIDLNTSFTGEDSFDVSLDAGNGGNALAEFDQNSTSDTLTVDGVSYTFPLYGATVFVGDNMDGSTLYSTACVYGGPSNNLDDCGNGTSALGGGSGTAAGASYAFDNGLTVAFGYTGAGSSTDGLGTTEGLDAYGTQFSYAADSFGASLSLAKVDVTTDDERKYYGLNGYWTPSDVGVVPSISVGYEASEAQGLADTTQWFVGLQWDEAGPGTFGAAVGTIGASAGNDASTTPAYDPELLMYEAFYSYEINDGMTITPLIYTKETTVGNDDLTGIMVKTSFSF